MYSYDKIKDVLICHKNKDLYGLTIINILDIFKIARSTLYEWIKFFSYLCNDNNSVLTKRTANTIRSARKLTPECKSFIIEYVKKNPAFNMKKLVKKITRMYNIQFNKGYIYQILKKNNLSHKKIQKNTYPHGSVKFKKAVKILKTEIDKIDNNYTSIDETGIYLGTSPTYGWSETGTRCIVKSTFNRSNKYSLCMAISNEGVVASRMIEGSFNTIKFNHFVKNDVIPNMKNDVLSEAKLQWMDVQYINQSH